MNRRICIVTGTRAEYGLLKGLMEGVRAHAQLELQVIVTGAHLAPQFGSSIEQIEQDGIEIDWKVDMELSGDTPADITKSMGRGLSGFADALDGLKPDVMVLLGDRYELVCAAYAALVACIPVAHIHGGETTEGAIDEAIRHSLTKIAYLHFTGAEEYRRRVIQLGEAPERVFNVGGMGVDVIRNLELMAKDELERSLNFQFRKRNVLVTFHPVTLEAGTADEQVEAMLKALGQLEEDTGYIFTSPNADPESRVIVDKIEEFVSERPGQAVLFSTMGQLRYLSALQYVDAVVGNSSSGIAEAPSFHIGTINIGDRQKGRLSASSVIDCEPTYESIVEALVELYSDAFQEKLEQAVNPYGEGQATEKILQVLSEYPLPNEIKKTFCDLPVEETEQRKDA